MSQTRGHNWTIANRHCLHILSTHYPISTWMDRGAIFNTVFSTNLNSSYLRDEYGGHKHGRRGQPNKPSRSLMWNDHICRDEFHLPGPFNAQQQADRAAMLQQIENAINMLNFRGHIGLGTVRMIPGMYRADTNTIAFATNPVPRLSTHGMATRRSAASAAAARPHMAPPPYPPAHVVPPPTSMGPPPTHMAASSASMTAHFPRPAAGPSTSHAAGVYPPAHMVPGPAQMVPPPAQMVAPTAQMVAPPAQMVAPPAQMVSQPAQMVAPPAPMTAQPPRTTAGPSTTRPAAARHSATQPAPAIAGPSTIRPPVAGHSATHTAPVMHGPPCRPRTTRYSASLGRGTDEPPQDELTAALLDTVQAVIDQDAAAEDARFQALMDELRPPVTIAPEVIYDTSMEGGRPFYHSMELRPSTGSMGAVGQFDYFPVPGLSYDVAPTRTWRRTVWFSPSITRQVQVCDMATCLVCSNGGRARGG